MSFRSASHSLSTTSAASSHHPRHSSSAMLDFQRMAQRFSRFVAVLDDSQTLHPGRWTLLSGDTCLRRSLRHLRQINAELSGLLFDDLRQHIDDIPSVEALAASLAQETSRKTPGKIPYESMLQHHSPRHSYQHLMTSKKKHQQALLTPADWRLSMHLALREIFEEGICSSQPPPLHQDAVALFRQYTAGLRPTPPRSSLHTPPPNAFSPLERPLPEARVLAWLQDAKVEIYDAQRRFLARERMALAWHGLERDAPQDSPKLSALIGEVSDELDDCGALLEMPHEAIEAWISKHHQENQHQQQKQLQKQLQKQQQQSLDDVEDDVEDDVKDVDEKFHSSLAVIVASTGESDDDLLLKEVIRNLHQTLQQPPHPQQYPRVKIFVVQPKAHTPFNRGKLLNIGFELASLDNFTHFLFHDTDLSPVALSLASSQLNPEARDLLDAPLFPPPLHLASCVEAHDWLLLSPEYVGGAVLFRQASFRRVNGYSNRYWQGRSGENEDLYQRIARFWPEGPVRGYPYCDHGRFESLSLHNNSAATPPSAAESEHGATSTCQIQLAKSFPHLGANLDGLSSLSYQVLEIEHDLFLDFVRYHILM